ncbi:MAG: ABC-F family ATP-binding cassette domain-containing protein [Desulfovibrio sp.]|jgi:ATP-binding cassette subfamily F protein 3|nr:ABC-F family ATP-binding cassette domain-containing protein [Desulfovibrio sp.]
MHLSIRNLSKSYGDRVILEDLSLEIQAGMRLCVCGPNGGGKSTLLRMLAGREEPDAGGTSAARGAEIGYVEQELDERALARSLRSFVLEALPDWNDFWADWERAVGDQSALARLSERRHEMELKCGFSPEHKADAVLACLGFSTTAGDGPCTQPDLPGRSGPDIPPKLRQPPDAPDALNLQDRSGSAPGASFRRCDLPLRALSGGMRERAKLARALAAGSDILLLDEPTNHLDLESVERLESFLLKYEGILVFVAHDRVFMDRVGTHLLYLPGDGRAIFRKGVFSGFLHMQEEQEERRKREEAGVRAELERKMDFVRRFRAKASKARQAASRQKAAKKLEKELEGLRPEQRRRELRFRWPEPQRTDRVVLAVEDLRFAFSDGRRLWDSLSFTLYRGRKTALAGPNGCGKSTLLRLITGALPCESGSIVMGKNVKAGYFSQHRLESMDLAGTVQGELRRLSDPRTTEEELMSVLGLFMLGRDYFERSVGSLSGGEKSRLSLAALFLTRADFLILDEPTNHLDLESREALIEALSLFSGTLLMVAHDRHLLNEAADSIWALTPQGFTVFDGGWEEYAAFRRAAAGEERARMSAARRAENSSPGGLGREELKRRRRGEAEARKKPAQALKPLRDTHARLERELEDTLARQGETERLLALPEVYADTARCAELLKEFHVLQQRAESLLERLAASEAAIASASAGT